MRQVPAACRRDPNRAMVHRSTLLAKEPKQRYQRASEVQAALEAVQSASDVAADAAIPPGGPPTTVIAEIRHVGVKDGDVLLLAGTVKGAFLMRSNARRSHGKLRGPTFTAMQFMPSAYDGRAGRHRSGLRRKASGVHNFAFQRRLRQELDQSAGSCDSISSGYRNGAEEHMADFAGADAKSLTCCTAGSSRQRFSRAAMRVRRGRWCAGCSIIHIVRDGCQAMADWRCIRLCLILSTGSGCTLQSPREASTAPTMVGRRGRREIAACELRSCRTNTLSLDSACTRSRCIRRGQSACTCKITTGSIALTTRGDNWKDIANGVPADFGFAVVRHPRDPDCVYVVPVESDDIPVHVRMERASRVSHAKRGLSWEPLTRGLPQKGAYETVLRDGMSNGRLIGGNLLWHAQRGTVCVDRRRQELEDDT